MSKIMEDTDGDPDKLGWWQTRQLSSLKSKLDAIMPEPKHPVRIVNPPAKLTKLTHPPIMPDGVAMDSEDAIMTVYVKALPARLDTGLLVDPYDQDPANEIIELTESQKKDLDALRKKWYISFMPALLDDIKREKRPVKPCKLPHPDSIEPDPTTYKNKRSDYHELKIQFNRYNCYWSLVRSCLLFWLHYAETNKQWAWRQCLQKTNPGYLYEEPHVENSNLFLSDNDDPEQNVEKMKTIEDCERKWKKLYWMECFGNTSSNKIKLKSATVWISGLPKFMGTKLAVDEPRTIVVPGVTGNYGPYASFDDRLQTPGW